MRATGKQQAQGGEKKQAMHALYSTPAVVTVVTPKLQGAFEAAENAKSPAKPHPKARGKTTNAANTANT